MISKIRGIKQDIKFCSKCRIFYPKTTDFFYPRKNTKDGFRPYCKECGKKDSKKWKLDNWEKIKNREIKQAKKWRKENREKYNEYSRKYHEKNKEKINERTRNAYHDFKKKYPKEHKKRIHEYSLKTRYGITREEYKQLLEKQNGKCVICGCEEKQKIKGKTRELSVDHDHKTGEIRGLLCHSCNNILGRAQDNPFILIKCVKYLKLHKKY